MARPRKFKTQLIERYDHHRKADHQGEPQSPLLPKRVEQFVHAVASSKSENKSTEPMPRTLTLVAVPKVTRSRTRSYTGRVTRIDVLPSDSIPLASFTVSPQRS